MDKDTLQNKISYSFKNEDMLTRALTHKSTMINIHNEQYEFLGDRVLGLVISENLLKNHGDLPEGNLDKVFSTLVNKEKCAAVASSIDLGDYLYLGQTEITSNGKNKASILADACEALIASIYLDGGYQAAKSFILTYWDEALSTVDLNFKDSKSSLQEWSLKKYKKLPEYRLLEEEGPAHSPIFKVAVNIEGYISATATAGSIKEAEKKAAIVFIHLNGIEA